MATLRRVTAWARAAVARAAQGGTWVLEAGRPPREVEGGETAGPNSLAETSKDNKVCGGGDSAARDSLGKSSGR